MAFLFDGSCSLSSATMDAAENKSQRILEIQFIDGSTRKTTFSSNMTGIKLRQLVMDNLGLVDSDCFGLMVKSNKISHNWVWLNGSKKISLRKKDISFVVQLRVRHFPKLPYRLMDSLGRRLVFLECITSIKEGWWTGIGRREMIELLALTCKSFYYLPLTFVPSVSLKEVIAEYGSLAMSTLNITENDIIYQVNHADRALGHKYGNYENVSSVTASSRDVFISEYLTKVCHLPSYGSIYYEFQGNANLVRVWTSQQSLTFALDNDCLRKCYTWDKVGKVTKSGKSVKIKLNVSGMEGKKTTVETTLTPKNDRTVIKNLFYVIDIHSKYVEKMLQEKKNEEKKSCEEMQSRPGSWSHRNSVTSNITMMPTEKQSLGANLYNGIAQIRDRLSTNFNNNPLRNLNNFKTISHLGQIRRDNDSGLVNDSLNNSFLASTFSEDSPRLMQKSYSPYTSFSYNY
uniref:FERM domain-containing protein n=1 Tax=Rhabditophanes sp. KR3021 TaxID=114890 RepID=A0AC35UCA2_9BILA